MVSSSGACTAQKPVPAVSLRHAWQHDGTQDVCTSHVRVTYGKPIDLHQVLYLGKLSPLMFRSACVTVVVPSVRARQATAQISSL